MFELFERCGGDVRKKRTELRTAGADSKAQTCGHYE